MREMMKVILLLCLFFSFLSISKAAVAKEKGIDEIMQACIDDSTNNSRSINCIYEAHNLWDKRLNLVYNLMRSYMSDEAKHKLKLSQRAWIKQRDLEFEFLDKMFSEKKFRGTMFTSILAIRKLQVVKERTLLLEIYLNYYKL